MCEVDLTLIRCCLIPFFRLLRFLTLDASNVRFLDHTAGYRFGHPPYNGAHLGLVPPTNVRSSEQRVRLRGCGSIVRSAMTAMTNLWFPAFILYEHTKSRAT